MPDELTTVVGPAGARGGELFHLAILAWALLGFANVYAGVARRAFDITVENVTKRASLGLTRTQAYHPELQHMVADMRMSLEAIDAYLTRIGDDWSRGVDHGPAWPMKIVAVKHFVVNQAWSVVDTAIDVAGGAGIFRSNRLEQLFRDARLGRIHPANKQTTYEIVAKHTLGIDPDELPRWG
jgi:alkylation response protein AidB-like acyl-CoA dehydrogenase